MSRSSPGRYSVHDFAKNVYGVEAFDEQGRRLPIARPDPHGWTIERHDGLVNVRYRVFGDQVDGTYLAIDTTHVHMNMPAALMWARGLDDRPATLTFDPPPVGGDWTIATQLYPGLSPLEYTAPNLQYLMDSPVEWGPLEMREFSIDNQTIRIAVHHRGSVDDVERFVEDVAAIVREHGEIFGEYPAYEQGRYTFLADYLPYAGSDGMEHRNSTVMTAPDSGGRIDLLDTASHEFFHGWNVERIRPRSLEPFKFERTNMSGELWLGEGFTLYYGRLALSRAGLVDLNQTIGNLLRMVTSVSLNTARLVRSAEEMSRMAPFVDRGLAGDRTNWSTTVISYYDFGAAIALALDLSLRERSNGLVTLDDYMRALWVKHGKPGGARPGYVDQPYTMTDAEVRLAEVSDDASFARDFFARYVQGHEIADYERLLAQAGLLLRKSREGRAWIGEIRLDERGSALRVASQVPFETPAYEAGLDVGDEIRELDGHRIRTYSDFSSVLSRRRPGDTIKVVFIDRSGRAKTAVLALQEDPTLELVPIESTGGSLATAQQQLRTRWLH
jgi:predicted metalloprotease with PDZ domain